jgi:nitrite reductase/ring-hydroxylating ferredoxin subunit
VSDTPLLVLCRRQDLEPTGGKEVVLTLGGRTVSLAVVKHGPEVRAYLNLCPHARMKLNWKPDRFFDRTGQFLFCDNHVATFDVGTGACLRGPPKGKALTPVPVTCDGEAVFLDPGALPA